MRCVMCEKKATWEVGLDQPGTNPDRAPLEGVLKLYYCDEHVPHGKITR